MYCIYELLSNNGILVFVTSIHIPSMLLCQKSSPYRIFLLQRHLCKMPFYLWMKVLFLFLMNLLWKMVNNYLNLSCKGQSWLFYFDLSSRTCHFHPWMKGKSNSDHFRAFAFSPLVIMFCSLEEKCSKGGGFFFMDYWWDILRARKYFFSEKFRIALKKIIARGVLRRCYDMVLKDGWI